MKKLVIMACLVLMMLSATAPAADYLLGNWENSADGWINWSGTKSVDDPSLMPSQYSYSTTGVTLGSSSLHMLKSGWNQTLALKLNYAQRVEFMNHSTFSIDVTVPEDSFYDGSGGYAQIYNLTINAEGYGWHDQYATAPAMNFYFWDGSPQRTLTLSYDYSAVRSLIAPTFGYIELIFATNAASNRGDFYFDNAKLSGVPEPMTLSLLGLGAAALLRKKK
jgi:hypothetical protein